MLTPADHNDAAFASSPRFSQNVPSNSCRFFSRATFCVSLSRNDPQKVARVFVEGLTVAVCYTAKWLQVELYALGENKAKRVVLVGVHDGVPARLLGPVEGHVRPAEQPFGVLPIPPSAHPT